VSWDVESNYSKYKVMVRDINYCSTIFMFMILFFIRKISNSSVLFSLCYVIIFSTFLFIWLTYLPRIYITKGKCIIIINYSFFRFIGWSSTQGMFQFRIQKEKYVYPFFFKIIFWCLSKPYYKWDFEKIFFFLLLFYYWDNWRALLYLYM